MVGGMEETSDSAITGQSILSKTQVCLLQEIVCEFFKNEIIEERLSAVVFLAGSLFFFFSFSHLLLPSLFSLSHFSFPLSHFSFVISHFIVFLISHFSFVISHFVAQISANVNIYRIDSSFLHIICAFLA